MDIIKNYLENMFLHLPDTEEVLRAKADLFDMMEDKYYELLEEGKTDNEAIGIVISEFGNLKELSKELGIDQIVNKEDDREEEQGKRIVRREEAKEYLKSAKSFYRYIGIGTMLCIYSPVLLILLGAFMEAGFYGEKTLEKLETCVGLPGLLVLIAVAVAIFIYHGMKSEKYEYLKKEIFLLDLGLEKDIRQEFLEKKSIFTIKIMIGVVLCILSVFPVIVMEGITGGSEFAALISVVMLLGIVGIAVYLFITAGGEQSSYHVLLQDGEYSALRKRGNSLLDKIESVYWILVTGIYLIWSFVTMDWHITWIIWPIAGVLSGILPVIFDISDKDKNNRKEK